MAIKTIRTFKGIPRAYQATAEFLGKKRTQTFPTFEEAERFVQAIKRDEALEKRRVQEQALREALDDAKTAAFADLTVASVLDWHARGWAYAGLSQSTSSLKRLVGDVCVFELSEDWTRDFCERRLRASDGGGKGGRLARQTMAQMISLIKTACARKANDLGVACPPLGLGYEHLPKKSKAIRERRLQGDEAARIREALGRIGIARTAPACSVSEAPPKTTARHYQLVFDFIVETCAAQREALLLPWSEIDLDAGLWRLPSARSKVKRARAIQLSKMAIGILGELLQDRSADSELAFHRLPQADSVATQWRVVMDRLGIADLCISDLRFEGMMRLVSDPANPRSFAEVLNRSHKTESRYSFSSGPAVVARDRAADATLAQLHAALKRMGPDDAARARILDHMVAVLEAKKLAADVPAAPPKADASMRL